MSNVRYEVAIGLLSGLNYGSEGCREGLWRLAAKILEKEEVNFVMLVGGLVDAKSLSMRLKEATKDVEAVAREKAKTRFVKDAVEHLRKNIPKIPNVKLYVVTSPAYDGAIGEEIARGLANVRKDILLYRAGSDRLEIRQLKRMLGVYAPKKGVWMRGDYYDTPILRVLKDELKRSTRGIGDVNAVGCFASAVFNPGDSTDIQKPYLSIPTLCKIPETRVAENQTGLRILKANEKEVVVVTHNLKDLVSNEWSLVETPAKSTDVQKYLVDLLKDRGPLTIGQFEDFTGVPRLQIRKELAELDARRVTHSWPGIYLDEPSKCYYFPTGWFQEMMNYPEPKCTKEDSIIAFGCLHAGCKHTDMKFFRDMLPELMLRHDVTTLAGVGDFVEGLRHDLWAKGELLGGTDYPLNYTRQEQLAAYLVSAVLVKVFRKRMALALASCEPESLNPRKLEKLVFNALPEFLYIPGNHCAWTAPLGFNPHSIFTPQLRSLVMEDVYAILAEHKLFFPNMQQLIFAKIVPLDEYEVRTLSSGLTISMGHPSMGRTKTPSIRLQEALKKAETNVVLLANFHVAEALEEWSFGMGQRLCLEAGTIKHRSGFEDSKMKIVDFGVVYGKVASNGTHIFRTETAFFSTRTKNLDEANQAILKDFERRLGL